MLSSETPGVPRLPTPSSFAADTGLRPGARVSATSNNPHTPILVRTHNFGALLPLAFVTTCRFARPPVGADQAFTQPTRTFTSGLPTDWSPAPPPDITTGATGQVPPAGLSPARTPTSFAATLRSGLCCPGPSSLNWSHAPHSQAQPDFAARRLIRAVLAVRHRATPRRPRSGSVLLLAYFLDMSSSETTGSPSVAFIQFLRQ